MSDTKYGLRRRATVIAARRKQKECFQKQYAQTIIAAVLALGIQAKAREEFDKEFEPQPRPGGLRGLLFDVKQWVSGVISRD